MNDEVYAYYGHWFHRINNALTAEDFREAAELADYYINPIQSALIAALAVWNERTFDESQWLRFAGHILNQRVPTT